MSSQTHPLAPARWQSLRLPFGLTATGLGLAGIVVLAAALRLINIGEIGQANTYYTAATESMLQSWHNFFYVAAEPGGSVSIDKPPVGLWLQAISAYFLGVNGFAVVLPQILAGLGSVIVLFYLVRRWFGPAAGLIAAFALAVTPVAIAVERNNTPDATLIFTLLLAAWAFIKATETGRLRHLLLGALLVGIGFNIKMMQAFLPLPAFYALYFLGAEQGWWRKIAHLAAATLLLLAVSLSWALAVDLTPADQRPYVGGSENNSVLNLMLGYNGIQRLAGNQSGPGGAARPGADGGAGQFTPPAGAAGQLPPGFRPGDGGPVAGNPGGPLGAGGMFNTGSPGPLRMFQSGLAAQVSWLLPFALIMILAMAASVPWWRPRSALHRGLLLWGGWLITCVVFFSVAGFFHQYYLAMLGAPLAAIVAMGAVFAWRLRARHPLRAALLLIGAAAVTLAYQVYAVAMYNSLAWWIGLPIALGALGLGALVWSAWRGNRGGAARLGFALALAAILAVPTVWSGLTTAYADTGGALTQAYAGSGGMGLGFAGGNPGGPPGAGGMPGALAGQDRGGMPGMGGGVNQSLLAYLQANTQDVKYLLVVPSSMQGTGYVLATGRPVLYAGGFNGSDPVIDAADLEALVARGDVRFVLWGGGGPGGNRTGNTAIASYLQSSCTVVTDAGLETGSATSQRAGGFNPGGQSTLYRCEP